MFLEAVKKLKVIQLFHVEQYSAMMKMSLQADLTGDKDTCHQAGLAANQHAGYTQLIIDVINEIQSVDKGDTNAQEHSPAGGESPPGTNTGEPSSVADSGLVNGQRPLEATPEVPSPTSGEVPAPE